MHSLLTYAVEIQCNFWHILFVHICAVQGISSVVIYDTVYERNKRMYEEVHSPPHT